MTTPISFTEHVVDGVSIITCMECGAIVTKELAHVAEHAAKGPDAGSGGGR